MSVTVDVEDAYQDGNVLAGPLAELFAVDVTAAVGTCTGCKTAGPLATLRVYHHAPGLVARCPSCDQVVLRLVRGGREARLDLRGTPQPADPAAPRGLIPVLSARRHRGNSGDRANISRGVPPSGAG